ncbi:MAG: FAD-dependent oxidoreductase [Lentisphaerae bacterium]|nr:FAD-dependent oxidoreductase [Lentisphaerota bacterium]
MKLNYTINCEIPVIASVQILVVGGGPGGFSAAVMAARQGKDVLLVEQSNAPGGAAYLGEITPFMSNHIDNVTLDAPLYADWNWEMWKLKGLDPEKFSRDVEQNTPLSKEIAMLAAEKLLDDAGVKTLYYHTFFDVIKEDGRIKSVILHTKDGLCAVNAQVVIDSTGDGDVAAKAGCPFEFGNDEGFCQPMTLCFKVGNIDRQRMPSREEINRIYDEVKKAGDLDCPRENLLWFDAPDADVIHLNTTRVVMKNGTVGSDLSDAEKEGRRQMLEIIRFIRKYIPGCENASIHSAASRIGVRESRRIRGDFYQTVADFTGMKKYPDAIARSCYHVDIHNPKGSGTTLIRIPKGEFYELSFRTLIPKNCTNLLMGCRAVSVDHALHSSIRIMPSVCSIGQAAGMGAAYAVENSCQVTEIDGVEVRRRLIGAGANLA